MVVHGQVDRQEQLRTFFDMQDAAGFWEGIFVWFFLGEDDEVYIEIFQDFAAKSTISKPQNSNW